MDRGEYYLTIHEVARKAGISTRTIRRKVRAREFPPPFRYVGALRWLQSDIEKWMLKTAIDNEIRPEDMPISGKNDGTERDRPGQAGTSAEGARKHAGKTDKAG